MAGAAGQEVGQQLTFALDKDDAPLLEGVPEELQDGLCLTSYLKWRAEGYPYRQIISIDSAEGGTETPRREDAATARVWKSRSHRTNVKLN